MAENKTKPTDASVEDYLAARGSEQQRTDCRALMALLQQVTHQSPKMWGPSIVGYGSYRYTYERGRTGEDPRDADVTMPHEALLAELREARVVSSRGRCVPRGVKRKMARHRVRPRRQRRNRRADSTVRISTRRRK
jgi:hypothetical protein